MKILAIRLENLASLSGSQELDFTAAPLRDAGLFAITGPTGAGKSTLLDALCLALYGNTPRLRGARQDQARVPDSGDTDMTSFDPRTLLRRGTSQGHAEVDFLGRDGRRYRARWAVRRARGKPNGRLQGAEQSLTDLDDDRLLTAQKNEFKDLLPERLGLNFDQFTRAVMLAQSEFAAFLKADDNARSELLEKLTDTAEYSQLSIAAFQRAKVANQTVAELNTHLADDLPAEPDARAELERSVDAAERELDARLQEAKRLEARQQWHSADERLNAAYREGRQQQQEAESRWQALGPARADQAWRRLIAPKRHRLARQAELPGEIDRLDKALASTRKAQADAQAAQQSATQEHTKAQQALTAASQARKNAEPLLRQARELAQRRDSLNQRLADIESSHEQYQRKANQTNEARRKAEAQQQEHRRRRDEWQAKLRELMGEHSQLSDARQAAQQAHDQAAKRQLSLSTLHSRWQEYLQALDARQSLVKRLESDEARKAQLMEKGKAARQRLDERHQHHSSVQAFIERSRAVRSESVIKLRESLKENTPCPVCGGHDHPWRHQPPATPEAAQLAAQQADEDRQLSEAQSDWEQAQQARDELLGQYRALESSLEQQRRDLQAAEQRLTAAQKTLAEQPLSAELEAIDADERETWLNQQRQKNDSARQHHEQALEALTRAETELAPLQEALRQDELTLTQLDTQRKSVETELQALSERLPPLKQERDEVARELNERLGEHDSADAWQQRLDNRQASAQQALNSALAALHEAERRQGELTQQERHEAAQLKRLEEEREPLERELQEWRQANPELDDDTLARLQAQPEDEANRQERDIREAEQALQRSDASLNERRELLLTHRRGQALVDEASSEDNDLANSALLSDDTATTIQQRKAGLTEELAELTPKREAAQQNRDDAVHALRYDDRRRARQQAAQAELDAARAEQQRWGRISALIGSADGKAFRRIAQAYNLELLLDHANAHLGNLAPRYRLRRGGSPLGLLVEDHDMADEQRSVHSLSGGETFLVSLALALGLASMASGELAIESLFIDEGFGSLDPQSLALAMEALDGLQAQGRRVGVISHIQEMHERIPVQIQVNPLGNGASRLTLVGD
ncbi:exonuclease SbcC [Onishia taeanensis]|uniref:Nuclease SbcCD subunit C n=1 Tax=Onishia taeanensis TaxID=284577 RepID=A0A1G7TIK4_9GAMM|nr:AAA family ATPase [Halomonas taeanensis]SDG35157.1 exonuclease SbcC [Halomonas taeanensis]